MCAVDFVIDADVNGIVGSSIDIVGRSDDGDAILGTSADGALQHGLDIKVDEDSSGRDLFPQDGPQTVNSLGPAEEPYVGQEFESEAEAHAFYNAYATRVGFIIRVSKLSRSSRDGSAIGRAFVCNKEGFRMPDKREMIVRQRTETRVGCRAMILVRKVSSGKWIVTKFVKEHTHPLYPGKGRKDLIYDQYPVSTCLLNCEVLPTHVHQSLLFLFLFFSKYSVFAFYILWALNGSSLNLATCFYY
ncbi:protein FAR1-RELATED SEQUENCE 6-like isoform X1 [Olea europaea var. sylvestris]|uniref:protein FAR1-RELATED SEQUENCE 6-like isoform X1 n=1 Tax=Olea europaea var. sylvestris TaxID=158386 RepID=UPI000C1D59A0|nr:protein FAR1-RELATED SEQUENCE 6-like isoform X1 [Olea europaea var. sylvestris]XP_022868967.1 protein FAR1-RELATED SEQUENCE 6-like isoform X1 [Olea europaea var. sylvestris]